MQLVIVHRYDTPDDLFGLHSNKRGAKHARTGQDIFDAIGLFTPEKLEEKLEEFGPGTDIPVSEFDVRQLISCAPIEWHSAMREGEMLERFRIINL